MKNTLGDRTDGSKTPKMAINLSLRKRKKAYMAGTQ